MTTVAVRVPGRSRRRRARDRWARDAAIGTAGVLGSLVAICVTVTLCVALATRPRSAPRPSEYHGPGCAYWHRAERSIATTVGAVESLVNPWILGE